MIDSHAHPQLFENSEQALVNALKNGVTKILCIATAFEDFEILNNLKQKFKNQVQIAIGEHPLNEFENFNFNLFEEQLSALCEQGVVDAIGECGFDSKSKFDLQIKAFEVQAKLCEKYNLPIVIHTRESEEITMQELKKHSNLRGVFHCFTGEETLIRFAIERKFFVSFSGIVTFKKNKEKYANLARILPLEMLLIETDAPFLSPEPLRGKENKIENIAYVYDCVAKYYGISKEELIAIVAQNYERFLKN